MLVYAFTKDKEGFREIEDTFEALQAFIDGGIGIIKITNELVLVYNDESKIDGLEERAAWVEDGKIIDIIHGDFFVCRHREDELDSIRESDKGIIQEMLKPVILRTKRYNFYGRHNE